MQGAHGGSIVSDSGGSRQSRNGVWPSGQCSTEGARKAEPITEWTIVIESGGTEVNCSSIIIGSIIINGPGSSNCSRP